MQTAQRRFATWIAVMAILWASFAPALSNAFGAARVGGLADICRASVSVLAQASLLGSDPASDAMHPLEHCPMCSVHSPSLGTPPAKPLGALELNLQHAVPLAFLAAPRPLFAWVSAQPRAPPRG